MARLQLALLIVSPARRSHGATGSPSGPRHGIRIRVVGCRPSLFNGQSDETLHAGVESPDAPAS
jgi:hypothetical protein